MQSPWKSCQRTTSHQVCAYPVCNIITVFVSVLLDTLLYTAALTCNYAKRGLSVLQVSESPLCTSCHARLSKLVTETRAANSDLWIAYCTVCRMSMFAKTRSAVLCLTSSHYVVISWLTNFHGCCRYCSARAHTKCVSCGPGHPDREEDFCRGGQRGLQGVFPGTTKGTHSWNSPTMANAAAITTNHNVADLHECHMLQCIGECHVTIHCLTYCTHYGYHH